jgi:hypothetical protein
MPGARGPRLTAALVGADSPHYAGPVVRTGWPNFDALSQVTFHASFTAPKGVDVSAEGVSSTLNAGAVTAGPTALVCPYEAQAPCPTGSSFDSGVTTRPGVRCVVVTLRPVVLHRLPGAGRRPPTKQRQAEVDGVQDLRSNVVIAHGRRLAPEVRRAGETPGRGISAGRATSGGRWMHRNRLPGVQGPGSIRRTRPARGLARGGFFGPNLQESGYSTDGLGAAHFVSGGVRRRRISSQAGSGVRGARVARFSRRLQPERARQR